MNRPDPLPPDGTQPLRHGPRRAAPTDGVADGPPSPWPTPLLPPSPAPDTPPPGGPSDTPRSVPVFTPADQVDTIRLAALGTVRQPPRDSLVVTADPQPAPANDTPTATCPRCGCALVSPDSLRYCAACGYCGSLEQNLAVRKPQPSPLGLVETYDTVARLPGWVWVTVGGATAVVLTSFGASQILPGEGLARAVWGTAQLTLGLLVFYLAQLWLLIRLAPSEGQLGVWDMFLSGKLWLTAFRRMPEHRRPVWAGAWALTAAVCALVFVGGQTYWATHRPLDPPPPLLKK